MELLLDEEMIRILARAKLPIIAACEFTASGFARLMVWMLLKRR